MIFLLMLLNSLSAGLKLNTLNFSNHLNAKVRLFYLKIDPKLVAFLKAKRGQHKDEPAEKGSDVVQNLPRPDVKQKANKPSKGKCCCI